MEMVGRATQICSPKYTTLQQTIAVSPKEFAVFQVTANVREMQCITFGSS
jgi:hypothetical protein